MFVIFFPEGGDMRFSPRILYVEDDKDSRELMGLLLEQDDDGYETIAVRSAEKALAIIVDVEFDLYILDYLLPKMTGVDLCRIIRQRDSVVPIMFYSAMVLQANRQNAIDAGANLYLIKPNDLDILASSVRRLLAESIPFAVGKSQKRATPIQR